MTQPAREPEGAIKNLQRELDELAGQPQETRSAQRIAHLESQLSLLRQELLANMTAYDKVALARHAQRPYFLDYVALMFEDFQESHGDRKFGDDPAIVAGFATLSGRQVCLVGQQKGRDTKQKLYRNFGMPKPEGYRKAMRVMKVAEKFGRPILTFIDTPGAYPGMDAEERGQAEAIAFNLREMSGLEVPVIATVTGEGGSGGALAIGVADRVNMLEFSIYSVIAPESCSAILWRDQLHAAEAAEALRLTPESLKKLNLIDEIIPEPTGGAHSDPESAASSLASVLRAQLDELSDIDPAKRLELRYQKFRNMGVFGE